jgi:hypothetical protein
LRGVALQEDDGLEEQGHDERNVTEISHRLDHKVVAEKDAQREEQKCLSSESETGGSAEILRQLPEAQPELPVTGNLAQSTGAP